jgi:hypothetical protein
LRSTVHRSSLWFSGLLPKGGERRKTWRGPQEEEKSVEKFVSRESQLGFAPLFDCVVFELKHH